ncbi:hypothetical protein M9458_015565, partial [Cirrhinus mrigala]
VQGLGNPAVPPWLLSPSSPPWLGSRLAPPGSLIPPALPWAVVIHPTHQDSTPPALPCPSGSVRLLHPSGSTAAYWNHLFHLSPPDPPRHPGSSARCFRLCLLCHCQSTLKLSALPPPRPLLRLAPPWVIIMAVAWVPPGSSCSKSTLVPPVVSLVPPFVISTQDSVCRPPPGCPSSSQASSQVSIYASLCCCLRHEA